MLCHHKEELKDVVSVKMKKSNSQEIAVRAMFYIAYPASRKSSTIKPCNSQPIERKFLHKDVNIYCTLTGEVRPGP